MSLVFTQRAAYERFQTLPPRCRLRKPGLGPGNLRVDRRDHLRLFGLPAGSQAPCSSQGQERSGPCDVWSPAHLLSILCRPDKECLSPIPDPFGCSWEPRGTKSPAVNARLNTAGPSPSTQRCSLFTLRRWPLGSAVALRQKALGLGHRTAESGC